MRQVRAEVDISASRKEVLNSFLDPEGMRIWWGVKRGLAEPRVGAAWATTWEVPRNGREFVVWTGVISSYESEGHLELSNVLYFDRARPILGPMTLRFDVRTQPGGTHLTVVQDGYGSGPDWDWYYDLVRENWPLALEKLKAFHEHRHSSSGPAEGSGRFRRSTHAPR
jgi:uncharacterized protein YndB with AHSA1/START domain